MKIDDSGIKAARDEASALLVQPDFADAIVAAYLRSRLPSPTDTRERVLEEAISAVQGPLSIVHEMIDEGRGNQMSLERLAAYQNAIGLIRALKSKPTEAPVEDGCVRVPREKLEEATDLLRLYGKNPHWAILADALDPRLAVSTKKE